MSDSITRRARSRRTTTEQGETKYRPATDAELRSLGTGKGIVEAAMVPVAYTFADAEIDTAAAAQARVQRELGELTARVERAKASLAKARRDHARLVARAISAKPEAVNWYDYPGPLTRARVAGAAKLSAVQLQRLMERYRDDAGVPKRGNGGAR
jgi:hypothetical protein